MSSLENLTDDQLFKLFKNEFKFCGPILNSTRTIYIKVLRERLSKKKKEIQEEESITKKMDKDQKRRLSRKIRRCSTAKVKRIKIKLPDEQMKRKKTNKELNGSKSMIICCFAIFIFYILRSKNELGNYLINCSISELVVFDARNDLPVLNVCLSINNIYLILTFIAIFICTYVYKKLT